MPDDIRSVARVLARTLLAAIAVGPLSGCEVASSEAAWKSATLQVYKTPTCGCCEKWIESLEAEGLRVVAKDLPSLTRVKAEHGVPRALESCHTATVEGYVVEGYVPAEDVKRLLVERPALSGLAVPGMPLGSPGMEHPDPSRHERYAVLGFGPDGVGVFARHEP